MPGGAEVAERHPGQRRLADPGRAAEQDQRARDEAAAEDPVELGDPGAQPVDLGRRDVAQRHRPRRRARPPRRRPPLAPASRPASAPRPACSTRRSRRSARTRSAPRGRRTGRRRRSWRGPCGRSYARPADGINRRMCARRVRSRCAADVGRHARSCLGRLRCSLALAAPAGGRAPSTPRSRRRTSPRRRADAVRDPDARSSSTRLTQAERSTTPRRRRADPGQRPGAQLRRQRLRQRRQRVRRRRPLLRLGGRRLRDRRAGAVHGPQRLDDLRPRLGDRGGAGRAARRS